MVAHALLPPRTPFCSGAKNVLPVLINWKKNANSLSISCAGQVLFSGVKTASNLDALNYILPRLTNYESVDRHIGLSISGMERDFLSRRFARDKDVAVLCGAVGDDRN